MYRERGRENTRRPILRVLHTCMHRVCLCVNTQNSPCIMHTHTHTHTCMYQPHTGTDTCRVRGRTATKIDKRRRYRQIHKEKKSSHHKRKGHTQKPEGTSAHTRHNYSKLAVGLYVCACVFARTQSRVCVVAYVSCVCACVHVCIRTLRSRLALYDIPPKERYISPK